MNNYNCILTTYRRDIVVDHHELTPELNWSAKIANTPLSFGISSHQLCLNFEETWNYMSKNARKPKCSLTKLKD